MVNTDAPPTLPGEGDTKAETELGSVLPHALPPDGGVLAGSKVVVRRRAEVITWAPGGNSLKTQSILAHNYYEFLGVLKSSTVIINVPRCCIKTFIPSCCIDLLTFI